MFRLYRPVSVLAAVAMTAGLAACSSSSKSTAAASPTSAVTTPATSAAASSAAAASASSTAPAATSAAASASATAAPSASAAASSAGPASASAPAATSAAASSAAASTAPGALVKIPVNKTITDSVMGDVVVAKSVVRNFPIPKTMGIYGSREVVLVEMTLKPGTKFYSLLLGSSFRIVTADGGYYNEENSTFAPLIAKAGYKPLPMDGVEHGKTATGWYAFTVSPIGSKKLSLRLVRLGAKVIGSSKTIPAKNFDVVLVG